MYVLAGIWHQRFSFERGGTQILFYWARFSSGFLFVRDGSGVWRNWEFCKLASIAEHVSANGSLDLVISRHGSLAGRFWI